MRLAFDETGKTMRQIIVVLDLATGKETVLRGRHDGAGSPAWSPDGTELAFISLSAQTSAVITTGCGRALRLPSLGEGARRIEGAPDRKGLHGTPT